MQALFEAIDANPLSAALRESIWGFPLLGALHVLMLAWFGLGLLPNATGGRRRWALTALISTGLMLFALQPVRYAAGTFFWGKMAFIGLGLVAGQRRWAWLCWVCVIGAARGIAYF